MSIQFRSRIKSAADYRSSLSDVGVCCYSDGETKIQTTYMDCMEVNGYFQYFHQDETIDDIECPDLGSKGCSCACNYVDDFDGYLENLETHTGGLQDDITYCECNSIGGVWLGRGRTCSELTKSETPE